LSDNTFQKNWNQHFLDIKKTNTNELDLCQLYFLKALPGVIGNCNTIWPKVDIGSLPIKAESLDVNCSIVQQENITLDVMRYLKIKDKIKTVYLLIKWMCFKELPMYCLSTFLFFTFLNCHRSISNSTGALLTMRYFYVNWELWTTKERIVDTLIVFSTTYLKKGHLYFWGESAVWLMAFDVTSEAAGSQQVS